MGLWFYNILNINFCLHFLIALNLLQICIFNLLALDFLLIIFPTIEFESNCFNIKEYKTQNSTFIVKKELLVDILSNKFLECDCKNELV